MIGTLLLGLKTGLVLGFCFGAISALSAFGIYGTPSALAGALVAASPLLAALMCFVPRLLIPVFAHLTYRIAGRSGERAEKKQSPMRAVLGTLVYLAVMCAVVVRLGAYLLWYVDAAVLVSAAGVYALLVKRREAAAIAAIVGSLTNTVFYLGLMLLFYVMMGIDSQSVLGLIGGIGLVAGTLEAIANAWITTPVLFALNKMNRQRRS